MVPKPIAKVISVQLASHYAKDHFFLFKHQGDDFVSVQDEVVSMTAWPTRLFAIQERMILH